MASIYVLQDLNGNVRYVGQTVKAVHIRYNAHLVEARSPRWAHLRKSRWITQCVNNGFLPIIRVIETINGDQLDIDLAEMYYISRFKREGADLTNHTNGGGGMSGYKMSAEAIEKNSKQKLAHPINYWLGKKRGPRSNETKKKISEASKGKKKPPMRDDTKKKLSNIGKAKYEAGLQLKTDKHGRFIPLD